MSSFLPHNMKKEIIKPSHFTSTEHKKEQTDAQKRMKRKFILTQILMSIIG